MKLSKRQLKKIIISEMKRFFPATPQQTSRRDQVMTRKGLSQIQPGPSSPRSSGEYTTLHGLSRLFPDKEPTLPNFIDDLMFSVGYSRAPMLQNSVDHNYMGYTYQFKIPGAFPIYATFHATYNKSSPKILPDGEYSLEYEQGRYNWFFHIVADHVFSKKALANKYDDTQKSVKDQVEVALDHESKRYSGHFYDNNTTLRLPDKQGNYSSVGLSEYPGLKDPKEFNYFMMNVREQLEPKLEKIKKDLNYVKKAYILQRVDMDPKLKPLTRLVRRNGAQITRKEHNENLNQVISLGEYADPPIPSGILRMLDQIPLEA